MISTFQIIHKILKPGGKWINFGPLLYHFSDIGREKSIEPPYDVRIKNKLKKMHPNLIDSSKTLKNFAQVLRSCIQEIGFEIDSEDTNRQSTYCQNASSMFQFTYKCVFFTCTKKWFGHTLDQLQCFELFEVFLFLNSLERKVHNLNFILLKMVHSSC